MRISLLILSALFIIGVKAQHTINIPDFENLNPKDKYPERSVLASYTDRFDILISLKCYSAWGPDHSIKALGHHSSGWWKIEINADPDFISNTTCYSTNKINDSIGDLLWNILTANHLFDLKDERQNVETCPDIIIDTIIENGKKQVIYSGTSGSDMPEYEFDLITQTDYKKLYFYSPHEKYCSCPKSVELKWFVNCINAFEKYLGR